MMKMETELQIEQEIEIPTLKTSIPPNFLKLLIECEDDYLDFLQKKNYNIFLLDQFPSKLKENDERLKLLDSDFFRLKQEKKYLDFLTKLFKDNESKVYISGLNKSFKDLDFYIEKLERFDKIDQYIILNLYKKFQISDAYFIDNIILFNFFIKGILREAISSNLYFDKLEICLFDGFDMCLPLCFKEKETLEKYSNTALQFGLYIRKK